MLGMPTDYVRFLQENLINPSDEMVKSTTAIFSAKAAAMLRWCDTLEAQLHQTRTLGAHLLDSTHHHHLVL